jgi:hypothetical protein
VTYLYAGLGVAMLLPIIAGLQLAVAMAELEASNSVVLETRRINDLPSRQQEIDYLASEKQELQSLLDKIAGFDCSMASFAGSDALASPFSMNSAVSYGRSCVLMTDRPFDVKSNAERKARLYVEVSSSGIPRVRDACLVITMDQRCALEQEIQGS